MKNVLFCYVSGMEFADITGRGERFSASSDVGSVSWAVPVIQPGFHIDAKGPNHSKVIYSLYIEHSSI